MCLYWHYRATYSSKNIWNGQLWFRGLQKTHKNDIPRESQTLHAEPACKSQERLTFIKFYTSLYTAMAGLNFQQVLAFTFFFFFFNIQYVNNAHPLCKLLEWYTTFINIHAFCMCPAHLILPSHCSLFTTCILYSIYLNWPCLLPTQDKETERLCDKNHNRKELSRLEDCKVNTAKW